MGDEAQQTKKEEFFFDGWTNVLLALAGVCGSVAFPFSPHSEFWDGDSEDRQLFL